MKYGRAEVDGTEIFYVVSEMAEEVLSQILPERALTADETREMLGPILDGLAYLHGQGLIHGHLKPSNVLVVDNQVKLSTDGLLEAGKPAPHFQSNDIHMAPESASGVANSAADIWALGVMLVETLTQQQPVWDSAAKQDPEVPGSIPQPFAAIVRQCLQVDPADRCTLADIRAMLERHGGAISEPVASGSHQHLPYHQHPPAKTLPAKMPLIPLIAGFVLLIAIIIGFQIHGRKTHTATIQAEKANEAAPTEPGPGASTPPVAADGSEQGAALNRAMPDATQGALNTIHGKVTVTVRVSVDATGAVTNADFISHGPSGYFARVAMESAHKWTFKPPKQSGRPVASTWNLRYEFRRTGVDVTPEQTSP